MELCNKKCLLIICFFFHLLSDFAFAFFGVVLLWRFWKMRIYQIFFGALWTLAFFAASFLDIIGLIVKEKFIQDKFIHVNIVTSFLMVLVVVIDLIIFMTDNNFIWTIFVFEGLYYFNVIFCVSLGIAIGKTLNNIVDNPYEIMENSGGERSLRGVTELELSSN